MNIFQKISNSLQNILKEISIFENDTHLYRIWKCALRIYSDLALSNFNLKSDFLLVKGALLLEYG